MDREARLAAELDDCARRVAAGEPLVRCLTDYAPEHREEIARLIPVTVRLRGLVHDPSPSFQDRLEERLRIAVALERSRRSARPAGRRERLGRGIAPAGLAPRLAIIALVIVVVSFGTGAGVLQAAEESLPDSPLYQVKEVRESAEVALTRDPARRVNVRAAQIRTRGNELERAVRTNLPPPVIGLLARRLAASTAAMVDEAGDLRERGNLDPARRAAEILSQMQTKLDGVLTQAPPRARPPLQRLRAFLLEEDQRLRAAAA